MILSDRLIEYKSDTHSPQAHQHSHMRPHLPGPDDMKSGFGRTDNWHKGSVFDFSPLFWSGIIGGLKGGGIGPFILGAINVLVRILLLGSPIAAALAVPIVFGALLLIQGAGLIILAFRARA